VEPHSCEYTVLFVLSVNSLTWGVKRWRKWKIEYYSKQEGGMSQLNLITIAKVGVEIRINHEQVSRLACK
jgi:hypothetical protein